MRLAEDNLIHIEGNMPSSLSGFMLVITGTAVMCSAATIDVIYARNNGFGLQQLSILIVGLIATLAGLRSLLYPDRRIWDGVLFIVYFAGIVFMGLKPSNPGGHGIGINGLLGIEAFSRLDFCLNIFGFIPLSYLMMSCFDVDPDTKPRKRRIFFAFCFGLGVSLGLEITQHSIPGRFSSIYDLLANGVGTLAGIVFYVTGKRWDTREERIRPAFDPCRLKK
jgi:hypothetical protein